MDRDVLVAFDEYAEFELEGAEHLTAVAGGDIYVYGPARRNVYCVQVGGTNFGFCIAIGDDDPLVYQSVPFVTVGVHAGGPNSIGASVTVPGVVSTANGGYAYLGVNGVGGLYVNAACIDNIKCGSNVPC